MSVLERFDAVRLRRQATAWWLDGGDWVARRTERPRRFVRPVTEVMSAAAWACLAGMVFAGWAAARFRWDEMRISGWLLFALLLVAVVFILGRHQLDAGLDLSRDRVVVGEKASGRLILTNQTRRRSFPMTIELPVGAGRADFDLPSLGAGAEHEDLFTIPTSRRGVLEVGPVRAVQADPLALLRRQTNLTEMQLLHVHPRTVPVQGSAAGIVNDLEGQTTRKLSNSDVSFHALRTYVPGDDRRYIHWKTTARTGTMMVRQFEETKRSHLLVALSTRVDDYLDQEEFELAVSIAGSLGLQSILERQQLSVATSVRTLAAHSSQGLLDDLAAVDFERNAPRLSEVARTLALSVSGASVVVMVCGSLTQAAELRAAARRFSLDIRTIVVRGEHQTEPSLRRVGETDIATVTELGDLAPMVRRLAG